MPSWYEIVKPDEKTDLVLIEPYSTLSDRFYLRANNLLFSEGELQYFDTDIVNHNQGGLEGVADLFSRVYYKDYYVKRTPKRDTQEYITFVKQRYNYSISEFLDMS